MLRGRERWEGKDGKVEIGVERGSGRAGKGEGGLDLDVCSGPASS